MFSVSKAVFGFSSFFFFFLALSMMVSPSTGSSGYSALYDFNSSSPLNNASVTVNPNSNKIATISWAFASNTTNATFVSISSQIEVSGSQSISENPTATTEWTLGANQISISSGSKDPCLTSSMNNQSVTFTITEASTNATSGLLAQYLNVQELPIVPTNQSISVSQTPSCISWNNVGGNDVCSSNSYFGLNISKASGNSPLNVVLEISTSDGSAVNQKIKRALIAGDGSCPTAYAIAQTNVSHFDFSLSQFNESQATLELIISPRTNGLWYLFLDYNPTTGLQTRHIEVELTVTSLGSEPSTTHTPAPGSGSGSDDDSGTHTPAPGSSSGSDDDSSSDSEGHHGGRIALIVIVVAVAVGVLIAGAVIYVKKRRANFEQFE